MLPPSESQIRKNKELLKNFIQKCIINKIYASDHKLSDNTYFSSRISSMDTEGNLGKSMVKTFLKHRLRSARLHSVPGHSEDI